MTTKSKSRDWHQRKESRFLFWNFFEIFFLAVENVPCLGAWSLIEAGSQLLWEITTWPFILFYFLPGCFKYRLFIAWLSMLSFRIVIKRNEICPVLISIQPHSTNNYQINGNVLVNSWKVGLNQLWFNFLKLMRCYFTEMESWISKKH